MPIKNLKSTIRVSLIVCSTLISTSIFATVTKQLSIKSLSVLPLQEKIPVYFECKNDNTFDVLTLDFYGPNWPNGEYESHCILACKDLCEIKKSYTPQQRGGLPPSTKQISNIKQINQSLEPYELKQLKNQTKSLMYFPYWEDQGLTEQLYRSYLYDDAKIPHKGKFKLGTLGKNKKELYFIHEKRQTILLKSATSINYLAWHLDKENRIAIAANNSDLFFFNCSQKCFPQSTFPINGFVKNVVFHPNDTSHFIALYYDTERKYYLMDGNLKTKKHTSYSLDMVENSYKDMQTRLYGHYRLPLIQWIPNKNEIRIIDAGFIKKTEEAGKEEYICYYTFTVEIPTYE